MFKITRDYVTFVLKPVGMTDRDTMLIESLKENIGKLKELNNSNIIEIEKLKRQVSQLSSHNNIYRRENIGFRDEVERLRVAKAIVGSTDEKKHSLRRVDAIIKRLDRSIKLLDI